MDTNLLLLLVVGTADKKYISRHKNTDQYTLLDFELLEHAIALYDEIVLLPSVLAEVSNLARQIDNPARAMIQAKIRTLVESCGEIYLPSRVAVLRPEHDEFGLTDACILELCSVRLHGVSYSLLTHDTKLAIQAEMLGLDVLNFAHLR